MSLEDCRKIGSCHFVLYLEQAVGLAQPRTVTSHLKELSENIDAIKGLHRGTVSLSVVSTAKYFATRMMAAFMKMLPGIEMKLTVGNRT